MDLHGCFAIYSQPDISLIGRVVSDNEKKNAVSKYRRNSTLENRGHNKTTIKIRRYQTSYKYLTSSFGFTNEKKYLHILVSLMPKKKQKWIT